ncbi:unnamed protein product [Parnassius mnemosyne]|uniref:BED-type domain-containing protein n=1 Tax=Parnassius mnemosyne TaxID=213953 RepID=A0AAV1L5S5_9NEOP
MDFEEVIDRVGGKSSVWHHFLRNKNKSEAKCKLCQKILKSAGGSTSSLEKHLKNIHKINLGTATVTAPAILTQNNESTSKEYHEVPNKITKLTDFYESYANPSMQVMVSRMASIDGIPLRTFAKSQDLKYLFNKSGMELPTTADTIRNMILKECEKRKAEVSNEIKAILLDEKKFSISFDEWTSNHNRRYIGLTLHSPNFAKENTFRNIGLIRIFGSMNAAKCVKLIESKLNEFGISLTHDIVAQTTDGCSLMVAFGRYIKSYHQLCIAHAIQLAIVDVLYKRNKEFDEDTDPEPLQLEQEQLPEVYEDDDDNLPLSELALRMQAGEIYDETDPTAENDEDGVEFNNESILLESSFEVYLVYLKT